MDTLQINANNGSGFPIYTQDLGMIQDENRAVLSAFLKGIGDNFIISGCDTPYSQLVSGGMQITVNSGWVFLSGEILRFDGQSVFVPNGDSFMYKFKKTVRMTSNREFEDNSKHDVVKQERAEIDLSLSISPLRRLGYSLSNRASVYVDDWHVVGNPSSGLGTVYGAPWQAYSGQQTDSLRFRKDNFGNIEVDGWVNNSGQAHSQNRIFTLPNGYHSSRLTRFPLVTSINNPAHALVSPLGDVYGYHLPPGPSFISFVIRR